MKFVHYASKYKLRHRQVMPEHKPPLVRFTKKVVVYPRTTAKHENGMRKPLHKIMLQPNTYSASCMPRVEA